MAAVTDSTPTLTLHCSSLLSCITSEAHYPSPTTSDKAVNQLFIERMQKIAKGYQAAKDAVFKSESYKKLHTVNSIAEVTHSPENPAPLYKAVSKLQDTFSEWLSKEWAEVPFHFVMIGTLTGAPADYHLKSQMFDRMISCFDLIFDHNLKPQKEGETQLPVQRYFHSLALAYQSVWENASSSLGTRYWTFKETFRFHMEQMQETRLVLQTSTVTVKATVSREEFLKRFQKTATYLDDKQESMQMSVKDALEAPSHFPEDPVTLALSLDMQSGL